MDEATRTSYHVSAKRQTQQLSSQHAKHAMPCSTPTATTTVSSSVAVTKRRRCTDILADVNDLVSKCSFSTTSYVPAATMSGNQTASMTGGAGAPAMTSARATSSSGMGAAGTSSAAMTGSASDADTSSASMTNSGNDAQNTGAAAAIGMDGVVGLLAGAVGIAGLL